MDQQTIEKHSINKIKEVFGNYLWKICGFDQKCGWEVKIYSVKTSSKIKVSKCWFYNYKKIILI